MGNPLTKDQWHGFDVFFRYSINILLQKQSSCHRLKTILWRHFNGSISHAIFKSQHQKLKGYQFLAFHVQTSAPRTAYTGRYASATSSHWLAFDKVFFYHKRILMQYLYILNQVSVENRYRISLNYEFTIISANGHIFGLNFDALTHFEAINMKT